METSVKLCWMYCYSDYYCRGAIPTEEQKEACILGCATQP